MQGLALLLHERAFDPKVLPTDRFPACTTSPSNASFFFFVLSLLLPLFISSSLPFSFFLFSSLLLSSPYVLSHLQYFERALLIHTCGVVAFGRGEQAALLLVEESWKCRASCYTCIGSLHERAGRQDRETNPSSWRERERRTV